MKKMVILISTIIAISLTANILCPNSLFAVTDHRFYGTYHGFGDFPYEDWLGRRQVAHISDIQFHLEYRESNNRGIVHGRGFGYYDGERIPFVVGGSVIRRGVARGMAMIPGEEPFHGEVFLRGDGIELVVHGRGGVIRVYKDNHGNEPPTVLIRSPRSGSEFPFSDIVHLRASVTDDQPLETFNNRRLIWTSDLHDDPVGNGLDLYTTSLVPGEHNMTFTAIDEGGLEASDEITLHISNNAPNAPVIVSPENSSRFSACQSILFRGQASDPEDGFLPGASLAWRSSVDGFLGTGRVLNATLSANIHTITLTAADNAGEESSTSIRVTSLVSEGNCPPTARIVSPENIEVFISGSSIRLYGRGMDLQDGWVSGSSLAWSIEWNDATGTRRSESRTGNDISFPAPSVGIDTKVNIILTARDSGGATDADKIEVYVVPYLY